MTGLEEAARAIVRGEIVAFPTESSFGLAVDAWNADAIERMFTLKGREAGKPPPVLIEGEAMLDSLVVAVPPRARELIARYWPGPLTLVLPARTDVPAALLSDGCIGVRQSPHGIASALVRACARPITATSANLAGQPPAFNADEARKIFGQNVTILEGEAGRGAPSTVARVDKSGEIQILRAGPIKL